MSKKDDVAYSLQTLCHPASEFLADGQRLTLFIKRGNEAASEILRLRAENEKLRDGVRSTIQERDVLSGENWDLRAENEKLCGLLREAWVKMESNNLWSNLRARVAAAIRETNDGNDHKNRPTDPVDNSQRVSLRTLLD